MIATIIFGTAALAAVALVIASFPLVLREHRAHRARLKARTVDWDRFALQMDRLAAAFQEVAGSTQRITKSLESFAAEWDLAWRPALSRYLRARLAAYRSDPRSKESLR